MAVYNMDGTEHNDAIFDVNENTLLTAYDVDGDSLLDAPPFDMVFMTHNVQWWWDINSHTELQESILETYDPDVIGFQEFQRHNIDTVPTFAEELLLPDYEIRMGNLWNKNAFASKYPIRNFYNIPHEAQGDGIPSYDRQSYLIGTITVHGKTIHLIDGHTVWSQYESTKVAQCEELFNVTQQYDRFVLMADFNTVCRSVNDAEYTTIMKQFVDAGYNVANCSNQFGFTPTWWSGSTVETSNAPCDHIITSPNITINRVVADQQKITYALTSGETIDHIPLIAYVTVT